jgi:hypothetical protein
MKPSLYSSKTLEEIHAAKAEGQVVFQQVLLKWNHLAEAFLLTWIFTAVPFEQHDLGSRAIRSKQEGWR